MPTSTPEWWKRKLFAKTSRGKKSRFLRRKGRELEQERAYNIPLI